MVKLKQGDLICVLMDKIEKIRGAKKNSYTAGKADPTAVTTLEAEVLCPYGALDSVGEEAIVKCVFIVSIGIEVKFHDWSTGKAYSGYFDDKWYRTTKGFFTVFRNVLLTGIDSKYVD